MYLFSKTLKPFDLVLVENDNSKRAWDLFKLRGNKCLNNLIFLFPTKSIKLTEKDFLFEQALPVAANIGLACAKLLKSPEITKENGILLPKNLIYRKFPKRIVIHPTSRDPKRNWSQAKFINLAHKLKKKKYEVCFSLSPEEQKEWEFVKLQGFHLINSPTLRALANYLYESGFFIGNDSGTGHLASNLSIPTLTLSGNPKRIGLWRPDWYHGEICTPKLPLPNLKGIGLSLRDNYWQNFLTTKQVLKQFCHLEKLQNHLECAL